MTPAELRKMKTLEGLPFLVKNTQSLDQTIAAVHEGFRQCPKEEIMGVWDYILTEHQPETGAEAEAEQPETVRLIYCFALIGMVTAMNSFAKSDLEGEDT